MESFWFADWYGVGLLGLKNMFSNDWSSLLVWRRKQWSCQSADTDLVNGNWYHSSLLHSHP